MNTAPQVNTIPHRDWPSAAALGLALVSLAGQDGDGGGRVVGAGSGGDAALAGGLDDEAARQPDSPISRFHGPDLASKVRLEAQPRGESGDGKLVPEPVPAKVNLMTGGPFRAQPPGQPGSRPAGSPPPGVGRRRTGGFNG